MHCLNFCTRFGHENKVRDHTQSVPFFFFCPSNQFLMKGVTSVCQLDHIPVPELSQKISYVIAFGPAECLSPPKTWLLYNIFGLSSVGMDFDQLVHGLLSVSGDSGEEIPIFFGQQNISHKN